MKLPNNFYKPLAIGAPAPLRELPVRPERVVHFFPPHIEKIRARLDLNMNDEGHRFEARDALAALFAPWFAARTLAEVDAVFVTHRVTWGPYRTVRQAIERDADLSTAHPMFSMLEQPGIGTYLAPASPLDFSAVPRLPVAPAPRLGEHTDEILLEVLGLSSSQVGALHDARIVAGPAL